MPSSRFGLAGLAFVVLLVLAACGTTTSPSPSLSSAASDGPSERATPSVRPSRSPSSSASPAASHTPGAPAGTSYTVQGGDTLFRIASSFGTSVQQLQAWNADRYPGLASDPNMLQAGWELVVAGSPDVTPIPAPSVAPTAGLACTANNRVAAGAAQTFSTIPGAGPGVAITLDMGGRLDPAIDIMNFLIDNGVCVTFFPTGAMSQTPIGQQVLAMIAAHPDQFEVGNHTMHHCDLVNGGLGSPTTAPCAGGPPSADFIRRELTDAAAILEAGTGQAPVPYWRPPYGSVNQAVTDAASSVGYTKTFMWDIDTIDWKPISDGGPSAEQIASKVVTNAVNGSNVLMHVGGYETLDALRIMVPALRERGFTVTSLSDLLN